MKQINVIKSVVVTLVMCLAMSMSAQVPDAPNPQRLVNDFAGIFSAEQVKVLEDSLVRFSKKTSNQVTIVTVADLGGMEASQFAYEVGEKWGVGGSKNNNGVVILIKPKNATKGQAFIAIGYGVEGALPDASCSRIVNNEMIPEFKVNNYYRGVVRALNVILPVLANEYSIEEYENDDAGGVMGMFVLFMALIFVFTLIITTKDHNDKDNGRNGNSGTFGGGGSDIATAILLGSLLSGRSSGRSDDSFGGGSFGGGSFGGGGFGGFGGGSFGGGGAGGSW